MAFNLSNALDRYSPFSDFIRNMHFHIMDVSFSIPVVLTPVFGFRTCTAPEVSITTKDIKEGNFEYKRYVTQSAETSELVLTQGVRYANSDFYDWVKDSVAGTQGKKSRRRLMLVQYSQISMSNFAGNSLATGLTNVSDAFTVGTDALFGGGGSGTAKPRGTLVERIPARAWMLQECIPVRYKAGTDFDAMGNEISMMELAIKYTYFTEFNTGL